MANQTNNLPNNPNIEVLKPKKTGLFTNYIYKAIPLAFDESMSYYETLCGLLYYLKDVVIPTLNNNANAMIELQNLYIQLKDYVDNYFTNLDVQEEINNKLDEMVLNGTLQEIIASYLNAKAIFGYDTVSDMINASNLINGSYAKTLGFYTKNDGGSALYKIRNITNSDVVDNMTIIPMNNTNLIAELIHTDILIPEKFGAKGDGTTDDTKFIQKMIDFGNDKNIDINFLSKTYLITNTLYIYTKTKINGNKAILKTNDNIVMISSNDAVSYVVIDNLRISGANKDGYTDNIAIKINAYYSEFRNLFISNVDTGIYIDTSKASGTLVENRYENIRVSGIYHYGLYLGANNNNKVTDGFISNIILNGNNNSSLNVFGLYIGSAAGYVIDGVHTYGNMYTPIALSNSYNTNISNIYIEGFKNRGIQLGSTQLGVNISNVFINHANTENTGTAIYSEVSSYLPYKTHAGNLNNIRINRGSSSSGKSIIIYGNNYNLNNIVIDGETRTIENDCNGVNYTSNGIHTSNDRTITQYSGTTFQSKYSGYKSRGITNSTTSFTIQLPTNAFLYANDFALIELKGCGGKYHTQSNLYYYGLLKIVKTSSGYSVNINNITNTLFTDNLTASCDENGLITINCNVDTTIYGIIFDNFYQQRVN